MTRPVESSSDPQSLSHQSLSFYLTTAYPCSYLPGENARSQVLVPGMVAMGTTYDVLIRYGFRRSGGHIYRPRCDACQACVPVRLPVAEFQPDRSQRRCQQRNADLEMRVLEPAFAAEHYALYRRYQAARHGGSDMDLDDSEAYRAFIVASPVRSRLLEWRLAGEVVAVALIDAVEDGLSAVYTFYSPDHPQRSLGTLAVLEQIAWARGQGLSWLYLGFWIAESPKMAYKSRFRPLEAYRDGAWIAL